MITIPGKIKSPIKSFAGVEKKKIKGNGIGTKHFHKNAANGLKRSSRILRRRGSQYAKSRKPTIQRQGKKENRVTRR